MKRSTTVEMKNCTLQFATQHRLYPTFQHTAQVNKKTNHNIKYCTTQATA